MTSITALPAEWRGSSLRAARTANRLRKRGVLTLTLCALLGVASAGATHAADYLDLQIERTVRNIAAVEAYSGVLEQKGLYGTATLVSEVAFRRPHEFRVQVTAPAELAGTRVSYHDDTLTTWWPQQELALVVRGFVPPAAASEAARVESAYRANLASYFYALGPVSEIAGLPALQIDQRARNGNQLVQSSRTQVYDNYSFPLAGQVTLRGGAVLDYRWRKIAFNENAAVLPGPVSVPPSAMFIEWDLNGPARTAEELAARVPKAVAFPDTLAGLPCARRLVHPGGLPAVAGWYRTEDDYLLVTASRDVDWNPFAKNYGMSVPLGGTTALLVISPLNSSWSFRRDGLLYTVLTNLHPEAAYREIAATFAPPVAAKTDAAKAVVPTKGKSP